MSKKHFIFDFDSTFISVETLDVLCEIVYEQKPGLEQVISEIKYLTDLGMEGRLSLRESLEKRIKLVGANREHLSRLVEVLKTKVTDSVKRNHRFFERYSDQIYIVSGGFKEFIVPIVQDFGITEDRVLANTFVFDEKGNIIGFDDHNLLCHNNGKAQRLSELGLEGEIVVIGDGYTDYEILEAGVASKFYAFTENVRRPAVLEKATNVAPSLDEILYDLSYQASVSYPKNRINVLLLENVHPDAVKIFKQEGYNVEVFKGAMDEAELCERIKNVSILGIRSKTQVTERVLQHANKLMTVGAFCIGTNQINLEGCTSRGIAVFNAPYSNTRSVVELAIGEMIMLMRNAYDKSQKLHSGNWDKSAGNSFEIRGKKLGIVGYGNIGTQLSVLAEALGMEVYYYDVIDKLALGNAHKCNSLNELLAIADVVSLHLDGRKENTNIFNDITFGKMKSGAVFMNLARGHLVDIASLVKHLKNGKIKGAAIDVFPHEPKTNDEAFVSELLGLPNVILTPHVGGSTEEAQANIGHFVPGKLIQYINTGTTYGSVNLPEIQLPELKNAHRIMHIHENVKGILAQINGLLANHNINILGQYLKTNDSIGYVITDIDTEHPRELETDLKNIGNTIRFRILY